MNTELMIFITNLILMGLLGVMIFYAYRLSKSIEIFRTSRKELKELMVDLSAHIEKARKAVRDMHTTSEETGRELQDLILKARNVSDDLKFMQGAGEKLAAQLGDRVDQGRAEAKAKAPAAEAKAAKPVKAPAFNINDREFEKAPKPKAKDPYPAFLQASEEDETIPAQLQSQAERDLLAALKNKKPGKRV